MLQVVEKKETHNYRCLFRVCFLPRDFKSMLKEDPVAFEYLYLQVCACTWLYIKNSYLKSCSKCRTSQDIQDVDKSVSSSEHILRNVK